METLKRIVSMDPTDKTVEGIEVTQWDDVLKLGAEKKIGFDPVAPEDLMTICYTSGTTGDPKGSWLVRPIYVGLC
jgi:long-subunit acyl-CoA synthetase (AMP-forming)